MPTVFEIGTLFSEMFRTSSTKYAFEVEHCFVGQCNFKVLKKGLVNSAFSVRFVDNTFTFWQMCLFTGKILENRIRYLSEVDAFKS